MRKIKKGDIVQVMRGKDAKKQGEVLMILGKSTKGNEKIIVKGINVVKKAQKPNPTLKIEGGLIEIEKPIAISNVMLIDPKTSKPTRVNFKVDGEKKIRVGKSGEKLDK
jgi:large subunit ribosomal protein L24